MLVTVVVVMLVGFVIAVTIAASVMFTIGANADNKDQTQAFIAAESGRDAALAHIAAGCNAAAFPLKPTGGDVDYSATIAVTTGTQPVAPTYAGATTGCPTASTTYIVVTSAGTGPDGSSTTIDSVYLWDKVPELQAGGVLAYFAGSVSMRANYTGDIVVRTDSYTCANDGTINGSLYVTRGSVTLSRACVINGNVWARDDVDASSQQVQVTGDVKLGRDLKATSNGSIFGTSTSGGNIEAGGKITLTDTGSTTGKVYGKLTAGGQISVGSKWTVGSQAPAGTPIPAFQPSLEFIRSITQWIDLDENSGWNLAGAPINACSLSSSQLTAKLTDGGTTPIMLDFRACTTSHTDISLGGMSSNVVTKDAIFLAPPGKTMNVSLDQNLSGGKQLVFVHEDASRDLVDGDRVPDCGSTGRDNFSIANGANVTGVKVMVYTPCGLNGNVRESFTGQLYSKDASGVTFNAAATYTCALMSWPDAFKKLGCKVLGDGSDSVVETVIVQKLGARVSQTER
ncbi:MAG: hypothetical protein ACTHNQ_10215 [Microbacterium sp.]|uniref:hypothetical protein n=1 Tax=Microbacterium sp. TaxID=51671 RepID=UPI003F80DD86